MDVGMDGLCSFNGLIADPAVHKVHNSKVNSKLGRLDSLIHNG
jgi:hypothetical protein